MSIPRETDYDREEEQGELSSTRELKDPYPRWPLFIAFMTQFSEPITAMVVYPFAPALVRSIGVTHGNEKVTGYYAGIIVRITKLFSPSIVHNVRTGKRVFFDGMFDMLRLGSSIGSHWAPASTASWSSGAIHCHVLLWPVQSILAPCSLSRFPGYFQWQSR